MRYNIGTGAAAFTVSDNGVLAYRGGDYLGDRQSIRFDRGGRRLGTVGPPGPISILGIFVQVSVSSDILRQKSIRSNQVDSSIS